MKKLAVLAIFTVLLSACASAMDREYDRYLNYKKELHESVSQGKMSQAEALKLDQQAYESYRGFADRYLSYAEKADQLDTLDSLVGNSLSTTETLQRQKSQEKIFRS